MNGSATFFISIAVCTRVSTPSLNQGALQRETVDHGGQHAHVIGRRAIHSAMACGQSAPDIAAADYDGRLHPEVSDLLDALGDLTNNLR